MSDDPDPASSRTISVVYTEALVRDAVRAYVWRRLVLGLWRLWALSAIMAVICGHSLWRGDRLWIVVVAGLAALVAPVLTLLGWWVHGANTLDAFRRMTVPRATFEFDDEGMTIASDVGSGRLPWSSLTEIWERPTYWMIFTGPNRFNIIPMTDVTPETHDWLRARNRRILKTV